jgi:hypothetical protein
MTRYALALVLVTASCAGGVASEGEGEGAGEGESFTAPPGAQPVMQNFGGPVLTNPTVRAIFFNGDPQQADVDALLPTLQSSGWWSSVTSEYGVGDLTVADDLRIAQSPPPNVTSATLVADLAALVPEPDPGTMYMFVIPQNTEFDDQGACCRDFDGEHEVDSIGTTRISTSFVCGCAGSDGPQFSAADELSITISHELAEAATDPLDTAAWGGVDDDHVAWEILTEGEIADMCEFLDDVAISVDGIPHPVQRIWSNASSAAGDDPCIPFPGSEVFFNSVPVLPDKASVTDLFGSQVTTKVKKIAIGQSAIIEVQLYSQADTGPWTVTAFDGNELNNGPARLHFAWDNTEGKNGDVLHLTITVDSIDPTAGGDVFMIDSVQGNFSTISMGMITQ